MSNTLQRVETPEGPVVRMQELSAEYQEIMVLGGVLQRSGYFKDVRDQAQAVTKILFGRELGISAINSMSAIHIIEGKPALSSNLMAALIKRSGKYDYRVVKTTNEVCTLLFKEKVDGVWEDLGESTFTIEDARMAGVVRAGGSWTKYPKAMLFARALSQGERTYCPDVSVSPLYVPEELGATVNESGEVVGEVPSTTRTFDVPRTTAPIPIAGPATGAAADGSTSGTTVNVSEPPKASVAQEGASGPTPPERQPGEDDEPKQQQSGGPDELIDTGRQINFHRTFKDALRNKEAKSKADVWAEQWLRNKGYVDAAGRGTATRIPVVLFEEVKKEARTYAASLPA